jgi:hypothetical protein
VTSRSARGRAQEVRSVTKPESVPNTRSGSLNEPDNPTPSASPWSGRRVRRRGVGSLPRRHPGHARRRDVRAERRRSAVRGAAVRARQARSRLEAFDPARSRRSATSRSRRCRKGSRRGVAALSDQGAVVDIGADFRFRDPPSTQRSTAASRPASAREAVYGLTEYLPRSLPRRAGRQSRLLSDCALARVLPLVEQD